VLQLTLADATQVFAEPAWIREIAEIVRGDANHLLIVVDSVHSWAEMSNAEATEYESLNVALTSLQKLAALLKCPILVVAERNRASTSKGGLNAAAGSRRFEYVAETVLDLTRDKDDNQEGSDEVLVTLCFAKNRNGAAGRKVDLKFHGARQLFREV
jgi:replicative DNA helicase